MGPSGSGKSTLALKLGEILGLPVHHIDCYFWKPDWEQTDKQVLKQQIAAVAKEDWWIIEGGYSSTLEDRFSCAELVLFLDFDIEFCLRSVKERRAQGQKIGLPDYLTETDNGFEELLVYINRYPEHKHKYYLPIIKRYPDKVIKLNNRAEADGFVSKLKRFAAL